MPLVNGTSDISGVKGDSSQLSYYYQVNNVGGVGGSPSYYAVSAPTLHAGSSFATILGKNTTGAPISVSAVTLPGPNTVVSAITIADGEEYAFHFPVDTSVTHIGLTSSGGLMKWTAIPCVDTL